MQRARQPEPCCLQARHSSPPTALFTLTYTPTTHLYTTSTPAAGYLSEGQQVAGPFLVVVPLSTVPNWIKWVGSTRRSRGLEGLWWARGGSWEEPFLGGSAALYRAQLDQVGGVEGVCWASGLRERGHSML